MNEKPAAGWEERRLWVFASLLVLLAVYQPLFSSSLVPSARDMIHYFLPVKKAIVEAVSAGQVPWIDRYRWGGVPLFAAPGAGSFYPGIALFLALPLAAATRAWFLLHLVIAVIGAYRLGRSFELSRLEASAGAVLWALSGVTISMVGFLSSYSAAALLPWLAFVTHSLLLEPARPRRLAAAAGVGALLLLTALPEWALYGVVIGFCIGLQHILFRLKGEGPSIRPMASLLALAGAGILAAMIAAPVLVGSYETARESVRGPGGGTNTTFASKAALPKVRWTELFGDGLVTDWTNSLSDKVEDYPYFPSLTPGIAGWALVLVGLLLGRARAVIPVLLVAVGFLLAIGSATPFFGLACAVFPPLKAMRFAEKHFVLASFGLFWLALMGLGLLARRVSARARTLIAASVVAATVLEKGGFARGLLGMAPASVLTIEPPVLASVPRAEGDSLRPRIYHHDAHAPLPIFDIQNLEKSAWWGRATVQPAFASLFGRGYIFELDYDLTLPAPVFEWTRLLQKAVPARDPIAGRLVRLVGATAVCRTVERAPGLFRPTMTPVESALPPFRFASRVDRDPDGMALFQRFLNDGVNPLTAYVEGSPRGPVAVSEGRVLNLEDRADGLFLEVEVKGPEPAYLMLFRLRPAVEEAFLDGGELEVSGMDFGFAGAFVPPGKHRLLFRPSTSGIKAALVLGLAGLVLAGLLATGRPRFSGSAGVK